MSSRPVIYFCFADPAGFSGQKMATELVMRGLSARGWICRRLPLPVRERASGAGGAALVRYGLALLGAWLRCLRLLGARGAWLNVNAGQTRFAFVRDFVPLLCGRLGLGRDRVTVSLHGSLFMLWPSESLDARWFAFVLRRVGRVTVLGERQRQRLLSLGLPAERVVVLVNTCEFEAVTVEIVQDKQAAAGPLRLLHLSSLIDSKGFPVYLEAAARLAEAGTAVDAVLCGRITPSEFASRFATEEESAAWIEAQGRALAARPGSRMQWVPGAVGEAKRGLFLAAQVFVLPTNYPVEAQPIVLLEAMAAGCAIVTTRVGEIETLLDETCAVFVAGRSAEELAAALAALANDPARRLALGLAARERYVARFAPPAHWDAWQRLLGGTGSPSA